MTVNIRFSSHEWSLQLASLLIAVGLHTRCSGGFRVLRGEQRLAVSLVEDSLNDLLLFRTKDFGQALVELRLL